MANNYSDVKKRRRRNGENIVKYNQDLVQVEKSLNHRRLKVRAMCTHALEPRVPNVERKVGPNGKVEWVCKLCGEKVSMHAIPDDRLDDAIQTVIDMGNFIKMMSMDSEHDRKIVEEVVADVQYKLLAVMKPAYKSALKSRNKGRGQGNGNQRSRIRWTGNS